MGTFCVVSCKKTKTHTVQFITPPVFAEPGPISDPFYFKWHAALMCALYNLVY